MRRDRGLDKQKGFTLVEIMIGIAVMVIIFAGVMAVSQSLFRSQNYTFVHNTNLQDANIVMNLIKREIQRADEITIPVKGGKATNMLEYYTEELTEKDEKKDILNQIYVEGDAIVWQHGDQKDLFALNRVAFSDEVETSCLQFQSLPTMTNRVLMQVNMHLENREQQETATNAQVELKARFSTRKEM